MNTGSTRAAGKLTLCSLARSLQNADMVFLSRPFLSRYRTRSASFETGFKEALRAKCISFTLLWSKLCRLPELRGTKYAEPSDSAGDAGYELRTPWEPCWFVLERKNNKIQTLSWSRIYGKPCSLGSGQNKNSEKWGVSFEHLKILQLSSGTHSGKDSPSGRRNKQGVYSMASEARAVSHYNQTGCSMNKSGRFGYTSKGSTLFWQGKKRTGREKIRLSFHYSSEDKSFTGA